MYYYCSCPHLFLQVSEKWETGSPVLQISPLKCCGIKILSGGRETFKDLQIFNFPVTSLHLGQTVLATLLAL